VQVDPVDNLRTGIRGKPSNRGIQVVISVGFIGLGDIGEPIAGRILAGGFKLSIWNRTPGKMRALLDRGAIALESPADLARQCDIVCTCVTDAKALEAVVFGPNGVSSVTGGARLLLDNSTIHPVAARELANRLQAEAGMDWLDVPVSGGSVGARAGTLAAMVGGEARNLEFVRPVVGTYANRVTHMGPIGSGQATKACNQLINYVSVAAVAEAIHLGAGFGIDVEKLPEALSGGFADSPILREYARGKAANENKSITFLVQALLAFYEGNADPAWRGRFRAILLKDMGIVLDVGRETGRVTPVFGLVDSFYRLMDGSR
jgi:3-hydroxyisobutyrate dehydrogenase-like beta-hydroxyacid dehydrogenase